MRYFLKLAYDGTLYHGWQVQPDQVTVQETINKAIQKILNNDSYVVGCGRTDTGVHASTYYAHFDSRIEPPENFVFKLNCVLPKDIVIYECFEVAENRHTRYDATERQYDYYLHLHKDPFLEQFSSVFRFVDLDFDLIEEATQLIPTYEEFKPLCRYTEKYLHTRCDVREAYWTDIPETGQKKFTIIANRFLRSMVRRVVGTLVLIGRKKLTIPDFQRVMEEQSELRINISAPPQGLFLVRVDYPYLNHVNEQR